MNPQISQTTQKELSGQKPEAGNKRRKKAHAFVLAVYRITTVFPAREIYGLTSQTGRAAFPYLPELPRDS